jgi:hypothetical protein
MAAPDIDKLRDRRRAKLVSDARQALLMALADPREIRSLDMIANQARERFHRLLIQLENAKDADGINAVSW